MPAPSVRGQLRQLHDSLQRARLDVAPILQHARRATVPLARPSAPRPYCYYLLLWLGAAAVTAVPAAAILDAGFFRMPLWAFCPGASEAMVCCVCQREREKRKKSI